MLGNVAKEVILDEGTKKLISKYNMPYFYVEKQENEIKCNVKIKYGDTVVDILKDKGNCFFRDFLKEEKLKMELEKLGFFKKDEEFILKEDEEVQFNFLKKGLNYLKTIGIVNVTEGKNSSGILNTNMLKPTVEDINNKKYITFNNKYLSLEEVEEILQALKEGKKFYKTKRNYFLDFSDGGILSFFNLLDLLEIEEDKFKVDNREEFYLQDKNLKYISGIELIMESKNKLAKDVYEIPRDLKAKLREYQEEGFNWINNLYDLGFGGILADEMGLGKTLQVISFLLSKRNLKTLVVVPTSLLYNWKEEIIKFAPTLNFSIIHGDRTKREEILNNLQEISVVLTTYGVLKNDIDIFSKINFDICIIDEAQNIKNSKAQISKAVKMINSKFALALTGTPLENNLKELWSIFDFTMPGFLFDEETFKEKFILSGDEALHKLKKIIAPFILRRLKKDVLDELPDKIENKILVTMTKEQKKLYNSFIKEVKVKIKNQKDSITILSYLTRLRQLCLDPSIVFKDYKGGSAKLDKALEIIKDKSKTHKILLFSQFTKVLKSIEEALKKEKINSLYLDGEVLSKERINLVNKFNDNNESRVFLISTKAGGTGLNLTSADVVIHFDPWWNPAIENQATDRAHRIGQKNKVNVIKLIAKDTIEEKIDLLQQDKNELISKVIDGGDLGKADLLKLSNKELIDLF